MKKNSSCRVLRGNMSPSSSYISQLKPISPVYKKPIGIDLMTCRGNNMPKTQFVPLSTKNLGYDYMVQRKKMFSNSKGINNENNSQSNINIVDGRGYDNIKNKINNLEGRLIEIKKNFQTSFAKKKDQKKNNKENEAFRDLKQSKERPKTKLPLDSKDDNKSQSKLKASLNKTGVNIKSQKDLSQRKKTMNLNEKQIKEVRLTLQDKKQQKQMLQEYVTTFKCQPRAQTLLQCTSESNLFKPLKQNISKTNKYYISSLINSFSTPKPSSFEQLCRNHLTTSIDILGYIKNSGKGPLPSVSARPLGRTNKQTIIFDLDETLIHCNENSNMPCDISLPIKFPNNAIIKAGINIRPFARECLTELSKMYQLIVFTASHECYANVIIDHLDPKGDLITHRFFRDSCYRSEEGFYVKDLRVIDRDLRNVLLVDNAAYSYCYQLQNGVPIVPFYDNKADLELKSLVNYLKQFIGMKDVRVRNNNEMRLGEYHQFKDARTLIAKLYKKQ